MSQVFPDPIRNLPEADIPLDGITAYLSQCLIIIRYYSCNLKKIKKNDTLKKEIIIWLRQK